MQARRALRMTKHSSLIEAASPDVLLVAYGAPAQDLWIARNQPRLQRPRGDRGWREFRLYRGRSETGARLDATARARMALPSD